MSYLPGFHLKAALSRGLVGSVFSEFFRAGEYLCVASLLE